MDNLQFLKVLEDSFKIYLQTGARSNKKLVKLHGEISKDIATRLGTDYDIKSLGYKQGKESKISGRYLDKAVDISIFNNANSLGGIAVKYIMSNYSQNSNNYFENMLGETANLRTNNKAYFQIVVLPEHLPYFKKDGSISKIEKISAHNLSKYLKLSEDNPDVYMHTPTKTLLCLIKTPSFDLSKVKTKEEYINYMSSLKTLNYAYSSEQYDFKDTIIYNDYDTFIKKVVSYMEFLS